MTKPGKIRLGEKHEAHAFRSVNEAKLFAREHRLAGYRIVYLAVERYAIAFSDDNDPCTFRYVLGVH